MSGILTRRGVLFGLGAILAAPAIARASSLMPIAPKIVLWGDGIHDDTKAMQALFDGRPIYDSAMRPLVQIPGFPRLEGGFYRITKTIRLSSNSQLVGAVIQAEHSGACIQVIGVENVLIHSNVVKFRGSFNPVWLSTKLQHG